MSITSLSPQQLRQAADLKERIDGLQDQLNAILGGEVSTPNAPGPAAEPGRKKRKMTAAWRKALSLAQKARWAAKRGEAPITTAPATVSQEKPKRKMTAAWKKALSLGQKARWAKTKGSGNGTHQTPKPEAKPKRHISPALRKARSEAAKARWKKAKAAGKSKL